MFILSIADEQFELIQVCCHLVGLLGTWLLV